MALVLPPAKACQMILTLRVWYFEVIGITRSIPAAPAFRATLRISSAVFSTRSGRMRMAPLGTPKRSMNVFAIEMLCLSVDAKPLRSQVVFVDGPLREPHRPGHALLVDASGFHRPKRNLSSENDHRAGAFQRIVDNQPVPNQPGCHGQTGGYAGHRHRQTRRRLPRNGPRHRIRDSLAVGQRHCHRLNAVDQGVRRPLICPVRLNGRVTVNRLPKACDPLPGYQS